MDDFKAHDGKFLTRQIHAIYCNGALLSAPLDFSTAQSMSAEDIDEWLSNHSLETGWAQRFPNHVPLALFVDAQEGQDQDEIRELLCVDVSSPARPVSLFVREGVVRTISPSLTEFLSKLSPVERSAPEPAQAPSEAAPSKIDAARALRLGKQYDAALAALNECLADPSVDRARVLRERAWTHEALGHLAEALADADAITSPDDRHALAYRGELHFQLGDFHRAKDDLERALELGLKTGARKVQEMLQDIATR